jgi:hypothetical protein
MRDHIRISLLLPPRHLIIGAAEHQQEQNRQRTRHGFGQREITRPRRAVSAWQRLSQRPALAADTPVNCDAPEGIGRHSDASLTWPASKIHLTPPRPWHRPSSGRICNRCRNPCRWRRCR